MSKKVQQLLAFVFGVIFVTTLIILAINIPDPTAFQYTVFRVVLALSSAGISAMIPGFLQVNVSELIRAGGALGVFVIIYFYNPATLLTEEPMPNVIIKKPDVIDIRASLDPRHNNLDRLNSSTIIIVPFLYENTLQPSKTAKIEEEKVEFLFDGNTRYFKWRFYANQHQENIEKWIGIEGDVFPKSVPAGETEYHETVFYSAKKIVWNTFLSSLIDSNEKYLDVIISSIVSGDIIQTICKADLDFLRVSVKERA